MKVDKQDIIKYIAAGLPRANIANIIGVTPSAITQLLDNHPDLLEAARARNEKEVIRDIDIEEQYIKLEEQALHALRVEINEASYAEKLRLLSILSSNRLNRAKKAMAHADRHTGGITVDVRTGGADPTTISIKTAEQPGVVYNQQNEMVAIDGSTLAPMDSEALEEIFDGMASAKEELPIEPGSMDKEEFSDYIKEEEEEDDGDSENSEDEQPDVPDKHKIEKISAMINSVIDNQLHPL